MATWSQEGDQEQEGKNEKDWTRTNDNQVTFKYIYI